MREPRGFAIAGPTGVGQSRQRAGAREKPTAVSLRPPEGVCSHTPARARTRTLAHTRPAARSGGHGRLARPRGAHKPHPGRGSAPPGRRPPLPGRRKPLGRGRARRPGASPPRAAEAAPRGRARRGWRRPAPGQGQRPAAGGARRRRGAGGGRAATYWPGRRAPQSRRGSHARPPGRRCRRRRQGRSGRSADRGLGGDRLLPRPARARPQLRSSLRVFPPSPRPHPEPASPASSAEAGASPEPFVLGPPGVRRALSPPGEARSPGAAGPGPSYLPPGRSRGLEPREGRGWGPDRGAGAPAENRGAKTWRPREPEGRGKGTPGLFPEKKPNWRLPPAPKNRPPLEAAPGLAVGPQVSRRTWWCWDALE